MISHQMINTLKVYFTSAENVFYSCFSYPLTANSIFMITHKSYQTFLGLQGNKTILLNPFTAAKFAERLNEIVLSHIRTPPWKAGF